MLHKGNKFQSSYPSQEGFKMSYNKTKTDPLLGQQVHEHLVKMGVETPTFKVSMDRKDKIAEIEKSFSYIMQVLGLDLNDDS